MTLYDQYIDNVVNNPDGYPEYIQLAVKRHLDDLDKEDSDYRFDRKKANRAINFIKKCRHTDGKWKGQPFNLKPFQAWIVAMIFGWVYKSDGFRRFQRSYLEIPRKAGKTELLAAIALYVLWKDAEPGGQVFSFASSKMQASVVYEVAIQMLEMMHQDSPKAAADLKVKLSHPVKIINKHGGGYMQPLSDDDDRQDGFRPELGVGDEAHAWRTFGSLRVLESGMGNRDQGQIIMITTAGKYTHYPAYQFRKTCVKVLKGQIKLDNVFTAIWCPSPGDDWKDKKTWLKVNPNAPESPTIRFLEKRFELALTDEEEKIDFLIKNLNIWQDGGAGWISLQDFKASCTDYDMQILHGRSCWMGIHCSRPKELVHIAHIFPKDNDEGLWCKMTYMMPQASIPSLSKRDGVNYADLIAQGHIHMVPGKVITDDDIKRQVLISHELYKIEYIEYDKKFLYKLMEELDGKYKINVSPFTQSNQNYTAPTLAIEREVLLERFDAGRNPYTDYIIQQVELVKKEDVTAIDRSNQNVGGVLAMCMAMGGYETDAPTLQASKYNYTPIDPEHHEYQ